MSERSGRNWLSLFGQSHAGLSPESTFSIPNPEIKSFGLYARDFELPTALTERLTKNQKDLLDFYVGLARSVASLYNIQEGTGSRANFYPSSVPKREILRAAEKDSEILSHYTIVTKRQDGTLSPVPMHQAYARLIESKGIPQMLSEAAITAVKTGDTWSAMYLRAKKESLRTGNYEKSEEFWLTRSDEPLIDIVIGLYDTYTDKFLGVKYSWEAWAGVLDEPLTKDSQQFLNSFLDWWETEIGEKAPKVKLRIDQTRILSGQAEKYGWTANSLPCQPEWRRKFGSKFTIFKPVFEDKFNQKRLPAFRSVIHPNKRMGVSDNLIKTASLRRFIAHEISHSLGIPEDIEKRLRQFASPIKELYCDLLALKGYPAITHTSPMGRREQEVALATAFADGKLDYLDYSIAGRRPEYFIASSVFLKFCTDQGNVVIEDGNINWENSPKVYGEDIPALFSIVSKLVREGKESDAKSFFSRYFDPDIYHSVTNKGTINLPFNIPKKPAEGEPLIKDLVRSQVEEGNIMIATGE